MTEVEALARTHTWEAINTLAEVMKDPDSPAAARISAAEALLSRGWGKARQVVQVTSSVERLTDDQLRETILDRVRLIAAEYTVGETTDGSTGPDSRDSGESVTGPTAGSVGEGGETSQGADELC
jgi:HEAT repeat protein